MSVFPRSAIRGGETGHHPPDARLTLENGRDGKAVGTAIRRQKSGHIISALFRVNCDARLGLMGGPCTSSHLAPLHRKTANGKNCISGCFSANC
jgi:hypothetical protein